MMNFEVVNQALTKLLGDSAADRYRVIGYQRSGKAASEIKGKNRVVQTYYAGGTFPETSGSLRRAPQHKMTFELALSVSAPAQADLRVINSDSAPAGQIAAALTAMQEAAYVADLAMDEFARILYQILMDALNLNLGLSKKVIQGRWVSQIQKNPPAPRGDLVVLTATMTYNCSTVEDIVGDTPVEMTEGISTALYADGDTAPATVVTRPPAPLVIFEDDTPLVFPDGEDDPLVYP